MQHIFEIYSTSEQISEDQWRAFYKAITQYTGKFTKFEVVFVCSDNIIQYFVNSDSDLASLSTNINGLIIRPVAKGIRVPANHKRKKFVNFVTGGSILDLKEKYQVKNSLNLQYMILKIRSVGNDKALIRAELYFTGTDDSWFKATKQMINFPAHLLQVDFKANTRYMHKALPQYLNIEKSMHMLTSQNSNALFEADTFPYFAHNYYLNITNYEFDKHSFIIGASGSGKSKLISLFVDRLQQTALKMNYRVIVIDPHASLVEDFGGKPDTKIVTFNDQSTELFASAGTDVSAATELTATLFKSLLNEQYNPRLDRMLRFSLFILFTAQNMSLDNLKRFLTEIELRNSMLEHVKEFVPPNVIKFFGGDFNEVRTQYYNETISPLVSLVDEMQLQPALVGNGNVTLASTVNENFLTLFSLNKVKMGEKVVKTVAGLLIQQIFLLAQSQAFQQKVILIIDEVSVVQNPALASILAEARKYNLYVFLTQQYFGQIEDNLKAAIFANVDNYYVFRTSEEDARALEGNLRIELPKEQLANLPPGMKEIDLRVRLITELNPRECLVRLLAKGQLNPCIKVRTLDAPLASAKPINSQNLEAYPQQVTTLPARFEEQSAHGAVETINGSAQPYTQTAGPPDPVMNLAQILAQQSSSRQKIRKETP